MSDYIIGGGISALVCKSYCPELKLIVKEGGIGGQVSNSFVNLKNLFVNKYNEKLLNDLRLNVEKVKSRFGFFYNNVVESDINKEAKELLLRKKLSDANHPLEVFDFSDKNINFGSGSGYEEIYNITFPQLVVKLLEKINIKDIIEGDVMVVDTKNKILVTKDFKKFNYDKLVSTIPATDFQYAAYNLNFNRSFLYTPKTYIVCDKPPIVLRKFFEEFDLIYCVDKLLFNRITKTLDGYIYEVTGLFSKEELSKFVDSDVSIKNFFVQKVGLTQGLSVDDFVVDDIYFLSRLSQWKHSIRTEDVVQRINEVLMKEFR